MKRNILYADKIIPLKEPNSKASESEVVIVVGVVGEWHGHPNGSFKITAEDLKTIKENFDKQQTEIVIDYEHQTLYGTEAPAAGWISELMIEDDKLLAKSILDGKSRRVHQKRRIQIHLASVCF